jgi:hypothetical protein
MFAPVTSEVVQHLHGRLRALIEKPIGEVAVGQCPGELQGADHQSEDRERVSPSGLGIGRVQARGDVVDLCRQFVGEDLSGCGRAAGDLVEQRGRWAAVCALVAVLGER